MNLSPHFSLDELTHSETAQRRNINNTPSVEVLANLTRLAKVLEVIRIRLGYNPLIIHSGYRSPELNAAIGGTPTSAHCHGLAADFVCPGYGSPYGVAKAISETPDLMSLLQQLIHEWSWIHVAIPPLGETAKQELLTKRSSTEPYERGINV